MEVDIQQKIHSEIIDFHCPRFNELPRVSLYKDQVITYIEDILRPLNVTKDDKLLTPTMLNNYVKQKVVSPPKEKRYNEKHLAYLIVVCILKQVFSLQEICSLIKMQIGVCSIETAYDYFCIELEKALKSVFETRDFSQPCAQAENEFAGEIARSTIMAFANKIYIQKNLSELNRK